MAVRIGLSSRMEVEAMAKTVHVLPKDGEWAVKREGRKADGVFSTQRKAIERARAMAKEKSSGQLAVHGRDGRIREHDTYGMPRIQDPPGKRSTRIEKAVGKITRDRLAMEPIPARG